MLIVKYARICLTKSQPDARTSGAWYLGYFKTAGEVGRGVQGLSRPLLPQASSLLFKKKQQQASRDKVKMKGERKGPREDLRDPASPRRPLGPHF